MALGHVHQGLDALALHQIRDLLVGAAARGVANGPARLLSHVKGRVAQQLHDAWYDARIAHHLNLKLAPRRDVAHRPARLLANGLLGRAQQ